MIPGRFDHVARRVAGVRTGMYAHDGAPPDHPTSEEDVRKYLMEWLTPDTELKVTRDKSLDVSPWDWNESPFANESNGWKGKIEPDTVADALSHWMYTDGFNEDEPQEIYGAAWFDSPTELVYILTTGEGFRVSWEEKPRDPYYVIRETYGEKIAKYALGFFEREGRWPSAEEIRDVVRSLSKSRSTK